MAPEWKILLNILILTSAVLPEFPVHWGTPIGQKELGFLVLQTNTDHVNTGVYITHFDSPSSTIEIHFSPSVHRCGRRCEVKCGVKTQKRWDLRYFIPFWYNFLFFPLPIFFSLHLFLNFFPLHININLCYNARKCYLIYYCRPELFWFFPVVNTSLGPFFNTTKITKTSVNILIFLLFIHKQGMVSLTNSL